MGDKKCFIITPLGEDGSDIRKNAESVIAIITPVLKELGYVVIEPHKIDDTGSITQQVINNILHDDMVIANLTGLNPNVMYELAVRHAARKPVVCIAENGTLLPFDIKDDRTIFYDNEFGGVESLKDSVKNMVMSASQTEEAFDNPIYRTVAMENLMKDKTVDRSTRDMLLALSERLDNISDVILNKFAHYFSVSIREQKLQEAKPENILTALERLSNTAEFIKQRHKKG